MNGLRDRGDNRREEQLATQGQCLLVIRSAIMIKGKVVIAYIYLGHRYTLNTFFRIYKISLPNLRTSKYHKYMLIFLYKQERRKRELLVGEHKLCTNKTNKGQTG
jgi:hypothetical protein